MGSHLPKVAERSNGTVAAALVAITLLLAAYVGYPFRWFSLHPLLMLLGFVAAAGAGITAKRKGGRVNTLIHAYSMCTALALSLGGYYVIYQQKVMLSKPHNTSWHAVLGLLALGGYVLGAIGGMTALHPDFGLIRTSQTFRRIHKLSSRASTVVAFAAIATGWYKMAHVATTGLVAVGLLVLSYALLLPPSPLHASNPAYSGLLQSSETSEP